MIKKYTVKSLLFISSLLLVIASCKKDSKPPVTTKTTTTATPTQFGLYEADSSIFKVLLTAVTKIGSTPVNYGLLFDTGSGGMVIDAQGILPKSMITSSGITFTGDSTVVGGITITNKKSIIEYGDDDASTSKVYGYLAYAPVTIGDHNETVVIKRLAFFLYYKATDSKGNTYPHHDFDTFGVSSEYDISFGSISVESPLSYFDPGKGLTRGFKMAALGTSNFSLQGTYVPGVVTLGLTAADLSSSSGFFMHQLSFEQGDGYAPIIPATITYNGNPVSTYVVFDTGTEPYSFIEDKAEADTISLLPSSSSVTVKTNAGFSYTYTTSDTENLTYVENPTTSGGFVSILGLEFFLHNEYLLDYTNHQLGLKNN